MTNSKPLAILKKLAKKTKVGTYDPYVVVEALNVIDPMWSIESIIIAQPLSGYAIDGGGPHFLKNALGNPGDVIVSGGFGKKDPFEVTYKHNDPRRVQQETAQANADLLSKVVTIVPKTGAMDPAVGVLYATKIDVGEDFHNGRSAFVHALTLGVPALKVTAPSKESFIIPVLPRKHYTRNGTGPLQETGYIAGNPHLCTANICGWLYKTFPDITKKAQAAIDSPESIAREEKQRLKDKIGDEAGTWGTCPVCDNIQKLNFKRKHGEHPSMVLHGYLRPGYGHIVGDCFGVNYPPYELSSEGCKAFATALRAFIEQQKKHIEETKAMTSVCRWVTIEDGHKEMRFHLEGSVEDLGKKKTREEFREMSRLVPVTSHRFATPYVPLHITNFVRREIDYAVDDATTRLTMLEHDLERTMKKIAGWTLQPLPGTE